MSIKRSAKRWTYSIARQLARVTSSAFFNLRCQGRRHWPATGGALVCANHQSFFDPVIVGLCCDRQLHYLARQSLFRWLPFRWLIQWFDAIPIEREGLGIGGLKITLRCLRADELVLMFPEGTRTTDGELSEIRAGFCTLARRAAVPIVPVGIDGAFQAWPKGQLFPRREQVHVTIGTPLNSDQVRSMTDAELMASLRQSMRDCLERSRRGRHQAAMPCRRTRPIPVSTGTDTANGYGWRRDPNAHAGNLSSARRLSPGQSEENLPDSTPDGDVVPLRTRGSFARLRASPPMRLAGSGGLNLVRGHVPSRCSVPPDGFS